jgi:hypothetical protein
VFDLIQEKMVRAEMDRAWRESLAQDPARRHEEGGYITANRDGSHQVDRWPRGIRASVLPPPLDSNKCYNGKHVVAAFHTHPNPPVDETGMEWEQGPSRSDVRWHMRRQLPGVVISWLLVYEIDLGGKVRVVGKRDEVIQP